MLSLRNYILVVVALPLVSCLTFVAWDLFSFVSQCSAQGYSSDRFLAYCESKQYGDYEHGAYFLQTEPQAVASLKQADIVFLGDSRIQHAFSTEATKSFFSNRAGQNYYLLGFGFSENYTFPLALIKKLKLSPKVLIVGVDERFFRQTKSPVAFFVENQRGARTNYEAKIIKQSLHRLLCDDGGALPFRCGAFGSTFRSRTNGFWYTDRLQTSIHQAFESPTLADPALVAALVVGGKDFIERLDHQKRCVIFVSPPVPNWSSASAAQIADALGVRFIPGPIGKWVSTDGSHLEPESAEVWSKEVLDNLAPALSACGA